MYIKRIEQSNWFPTGRLVNLGTGMALTHNMETNTFKPWRFDTSFEAYS